MGRLTHRLLRRGYDHGNEAGQTLVEFAMILPLFLVLLFALVDFGRAFHTWLVVTNAAREGARVAATQQDYAAVETRIHDSLSSLDPALVDIDPTNIQGARGDVVEIDLEYAFEFVTPLGGIVNIMSGGTVDAPIIRAHASMRLE